MNWSKEELAPRIVFNSSYNIFTQSRRQEGNIKITAYMWLRLWDRSEGLNVKWRSLYLHDDTCSHANTILTSQAINCVSVLGVKFKLIAEFSIILYSIVYRSPYLFWNISLVKSSLKTGTATLVFNTLIFLPLLKRWSDITSVAG